MEKKREYLRGDEDDIEKAKYPEKSPLGTKTTSAPRSRGSVTSLSAFIVAFIVRQINIQSK